MIGLAILLFVYGLLHLKPQARHHLLKTRRDKAAVAAGITFMFAGGQHFTETANLNWFGSSTVVIYATGAAAVLAGLAMIPRRTRRVAAYVLVALVCAMLPADIYFHDRAWYLWARMPLQVVYLAWLLWTAEVFASERT